MNWYKTANNLNRSPISAINRALVRFANDAREVVFIGDIRQTPDGFVYVDIPNSIFDGFLPLLGGDSAASRAQGVQKPPASDKHYNVGAHISVIKASEIREMNIAFKDAGTKVQYVIGGVQRVDGPEGWAEIETVWFLTVRSPDLEALRQKYGLSPRIRDHDFHITIGVKPRLLLNDGAS